MPVDTARVSVTLAFRGIEVGEGREMDDFQAEEGLTKVLGIECMTGLKSFRVGQMGTPQVTST